MGNQLCCEADLQKSMIVDDVNKQQEFFESDWPENDTVLQSWISKNQKPEEFSKIKKHFKENKYFVGQWVDGVPAHKGIMYKPEVYLYSGEFHNGQANGEGKIQLLKDDSFYFGQILNGKAQGQGVYENLTENYKFEGIWENSKPKYGKLKMMGDPNVKEIQFINFAQRKAKVEYRDQRVYEGDLDFQHLVPDGVGTVYFSSKNSKKLYEGGWKNGKMHGKGVFKWRDNSEYEGSYVEGRKEGYGKFIYPSGKIYKGFWKEGKQDGTGISYEKIGIEMKRGLWKKGQFSQVSKEQWENQNTRCEKQFGIESERPIIIQEQKKEEEQMQREENKEKERKDKEEEKNEQKRINMVRNSPGGSEKNGNEKVEEKEKIKSLQIQNSYVFVEEKKLEEETEGKKRSETALERGENPEKEGDRK